MVERIMMGLMLGGIAFGCVLVLYPFMSALLWAAILTFSTWPIYVRLRRHTNPLIAALGMTVMSALVLVVPLTLVVSSSIVDLPQTLPYAINSITTLIHLPSLPAWLQHVPHIGPQLNETWEKWRVDVGNIDQMIRPYSGRIVQSVLSGAMQLASGLAHLGMALFIAFFFWLGGEALGDTFVSVIRRIAGIYADRILGIIGRTIRGTVYGIIGTALLQGVLTGVGFAIAGISNPVLWGGITAFISVLPIGAPLIWIPAAVFLFIGHHPGWGVFLLLYGTIIVSGADHIMRPMFIARGAQLPYLLTVLGVLGGIWTFGGLGIFLGPVLIGVGYTLTAEFAAGDPATRMSPEVREPFVEP
ncbi:AI-2E family transporter [Novacetimonas pomaceti]|uniref:AI-2E family transporter n=1 Tax=Novacetimonas pomaceti TaxID=2021998 RepID=A0ABX5P5F7_9PROT|nr:AI-2E family transporter [Novacetimonas pomaceti]MBV1834091.1 AI-2E family transporter [Novacetimonas pomaceti]PYD48018.1 AI-2E family transporter [Novacetimonas pomaceti]